MTTYQLLMLYALSDSCLTKSLALLSHTDFLEDHVIQVLAIYTSALIQTKKHVSKMLRTVENKKRIAPEDLLILQKDLTDCNDLEEELCCYLSISVH